MLIQFAGWKASKNRSCSPGRSWISVGDSSILRRVWIWTCRCFLRWRLSPVDRSMRMPFENRMNWPGCPGCHHLLYSLSTWDYGSLLFEKSAWNSRIASIDRIHWNVSKFQSCLHALSDREGLASLAFLDDHCTPCSSFRLPVSWHGSGHSPVALSVSGDEGTTLTARTQGGTMERKSP